MVGFKCGVALFLASTQLPKLFGFKGGHGSFSLLVGVLLIGDRLQELMQRPRRAPLYSVLLGLVLLLLPEILADFLHMTLPLPFRHLGLGLLSSLLVFATTAAGLGALVLSHSGAGWSRQSPQPAA